MILRHVLPHMRASISFDVWWTHQCVYNSRSARRSTFRWKTTKRNICNGPTSTRATTHTRCNRKTLFVYSIGYGAIHPIAVCSTIPYWLIQLNTILQISERIMHKLRCCTIAQFARWDNSSVRNPAFRFASEVTAWSLYQLIWFSRHFPTFW